MSVRIEGDGDGHAVLELQVRRIGAFDAAGWVGDNGCAADAAHHAAPQHSHDIELNRTLAQHQARRGCEVGTATRCNSLRRS